MNNQTRIQNNNYSTISRQNNPRGQQFNKVICNVKNYKIMEFEQPSQYLSVIVIKKGNNEIIIKSLKKN